MFQLYGTARAGCVFALSAAYIKWRSRVSAEASRGESKAQHLHDAGGDLADDPATAATRRDFGHRRGGAARRSGGFTAERVSARAAEADLAQDRRLESCTAEIAKAIMQVVGELILRLREMLNPAGGRV
jgi:hypothetical protein